MPKDASFTFTLSPGLRDAFLAEAEATRQPAEDLARDLVHRFVDERRAARDHDARFRAEVEAGLREADDPTVARVPHETVAAELEARRLRLEAATGGRSD